MFRARRNTNLNALREEDPIADLQATEEPTTSIDRRWPRGPRGYAPILLAKPGELHALERLDTALRGRVIPLIEAREARIDRTTGELRRSLESQVEVNVTALARTFGQRTEFFLDPAALGEMTGAVVLRGGPDDGHRGGLSDGHRGRGRAEACRRWPSALLRWVKPAG